MLYDVDTTFSYTTYQWIEIDVLKAGKHIHHEMCGHGRERSVKVLMLDHKDEKTPAYILTYGYEPKTNTIYQFHGFNWHGRTCIKKL